MLRHRYALTTTRTSGLTTDDNGRLRMEGDKKERMPKNSVDLVSLVWYTRTYGHTDQ